MNVFGLFEPSRHDNLETVGDKSGERFGRARGLLKRGENGRHARRRFGVTAVIKFVGALFGILFCYPLRRKGNIVLIFILPDSVRCSF